MTDRPIPFSGPMVQALLDGRKTQTRRVLKPQPDPNAPIAGAEFVEMHGDPGRWCWLNGFDGSIVAPFDVPYAVGQRLWVREAWNAFQFSQDGDEAWPCECIPTLQEQNDADELGHRYGAAQIIYRESDRAREWFSDQKWRPSIFMPRWASRLTLTVTDVRVQRVQEISEEDAKAEGVENSYQMGNWWRGGLEANWHETARPAFSDLWNSLNAKRGYGWDENSWVSATTFTVHHCNIDQMECAA